MSFLHPFKTLPDTISWGNLFRFAVASKNNARPFNVFKHFLLELLSVRGVKIELFLLDFIHCRSIKSVSSSRRKKFDFLSDSLKPNGNLIQQRYTSEFLDLSVYQWYPKGTLIH